jgi:(1->4)-alpha-D-glucan 1-alpha-D-glucosylmutase
VTPPLRATCRLQLNADFDLRAARAVVPYLARLGISHVYASPVLESRGGSTHGYDVVDPTRLDPDLGTEEDWRELIDELRARGMGLLLDIVPNHMATGHENPYWEDVLALGRRSRHAAWFDIDWEAPQRDLRGRVMLPVLGDSLGKVIARGEISLVRQGDRVRVKYFDHTFPLSPESMAGLPRDLGALDGKAIAAILARQHYRLAHWRRAAREINYRRFFDINDLVAIRQEDPVVFDATHAKILGWVRAGVGG